MIHKGIEMKDTKQNIKKLREAKKITLSNAAVALNMEENLLIQLENGNKEITPSELLKIENYYKTFSCVQNDIEIEEGVACGFELAEDRAVYNKISISEKTEIIIGKIKSFLKEDNRISAAYLFGSYARGEEKPDSDVDLMVEFKTDKNYSFFDLLDISFFLEKRINIKLDIVEKGFIHDFALQTATNDLIKIYG